MSTKQANLNFDTSTFANFASPWAVASVNGSGNPASGGLSYALYALGFTQQNDTGQVVWLASSFTLTQATRTGGNTSYNYSSFTGPAPRIGMSVTITGFTNGGNNVTAAITALGAGSFTVVNGTGVTETHAGTAATTANSSVPTVQATVTNGVYEIWAFANSVSCPIVFKLEYGQCASNIPGLAVTFGSTSNGSGTIGGNTGIREFVGYVSATSGASSTYECDVASDGASWLTVLMWRNGSAGAPLYFGCERSISGTSAGAPVYNGLYFTYVIGRNTSAPYWAQNTVFANGTAGATTGVRNTCLAIPALGQATTIVTNNTTPVIPSFPLLGFVGNPMTIVVGLCNADAVEGTQFTTSYYGATHTYLPTKTTFAGQAGGNNYYGIAIRWE